MMPVRKSLICIGLAAGGFACKFPYPDSVDGDASSNADALSADATVDGPGACAPDSIVCDDALGVYTDCSSEGIVELELRCPLGCAPDIEKCLDIDPSFGLATYLDMAVDPPDLQLSGTTIIDTEMGTIFVNGESVAPPRFLSPAGFRVFLVGSMSITGNVTVVFDYANPALAFLALGDVTITGSLDVSAELNRGGPSASWGNDQSGRAECNANWALVAPGGGGSGGGGGVERGGNGGQGTATGGLAGGDALAPFAPFTGGCEGGTTAVGTGDGAGGGGGGALHIASRSRIEIKGPAPSTRAAVEDS